MTQPVFPRTIMSNKDSMRVTIPKEIAIALHLKPRQAINIYIKDGGVMIEPLKEEPTD